MEDVRYFYMEKVYRGWNLPVFLLDEADRVLYRPEELERQPDPETAAQVRQVCMERDMPQIRFEDARIFYMGFLCGKELYLIGPAAIGALSREELLAFRHRKRESEALVPGVTLRQGLCALSMLYAGITGEMLSEEEIAHASGLQTVPEKDRQERDESRFAWQMELFRKSLTFKTFENEKSFIEEFRTGQMRISDEVILTDMWELEGVGSLARDDFSKQCEYAIVSAAILMRHAAIEEGVPGATGYRICDDALRRLSKTNTPLEILYVYRDIVNEFGEEICRVKGKNDSDALQDRCKDYITGHIRTSFTIQEMAADLGYHAGYLSRKFSETEGITLQQYITQERLRKTADLLKNSDEKIGTISEYMGFSSQKRMAEQFAGQYGMSPSAYRKKNRH